MNKPHCIRVCLGTDGTACYWPYDGEDIGPEPLDAEDAIHLMTSGQVPIEVATCDPHDDQIHNYESINALTLSRI